MIPHRNISLLSNRLSRAGGRRIPETVLERDRYLTERQGMELVAHIAEIASKLEFRGRTQKGIGEEFGKKEARLKKLWQMRLAKQMDKLPHFEEVFRAVQRSFRGAGLMGS